MRTLLNWLALACLVPGIVGAGLLFVLEYRQNRVQLERDTIQTARALVQSVDNYLLRSQSAVSALSVVGSIAKGDFALFHRQARDAIARAGLGGNIVLMDGSGQQIVNTLREFGQPLPRTGSPELVRRVMETGKPAVSDLFIGGITRRPLMSVAVPVVAAGKVVYVLSLSIEPEQFSGILRQQSLPGGRMANIVDSKGVIVGRSHFPEKFVGQPVPKALRDKMKESREGVLDLTSMEGIPIRSTFSISPITRWGVSIGIPRQTLQEELTHTLFLLALGLVILFSLGLGLAWFMGGRIAESVRALKAPATALGGGEAVAIPQVHIREAAEVASAMEQAAKLLAERTSALQAREAELAARTAALRQSEARLQTLTDHAPVALALFDSDMRYLAVSQRWRDDYCLGAQDLIGQSHYEVFPDIPDAWKAAHRRGLAGEVLRSEADRFERADGSVQWLRWEIWPWRDDTGAVAGIVIAVEEITERMKALDALRRSRELLRLIMDSFPYLIAYVDAEYRYHLANASYQRWFGLPSERIVGRTVREVLGDAVWGEVQPWLERAMAGEAVNFEKELPYPAGGTRWVSVTYSPDREEGGRVRGVAVMVSDITDRVQAEMALRDREEKLGAIVTHSFSALSLKDPEGRYVLANPNLQRILARSEAEITGKTDFDLYPEETARAFRANDEVVLNTRSRHSTEEVVPEGGRSRVYMSNIFPVLEADGTVRYICRISVDITDRKRADEEIRRLNADLERQVNARTAELRLANEALLRSNMELQNFAHAAAHDLQTPLRSIVGFAQLIQQRLQGQMDEQAGEWLTYVISNTRRLHTLIQELLTYSRLGALARPFEPVNLAEVFEQAASILAAPIAEAGAEVSRGNLPTLLADRTQMAQLLQNLMENGIKYNRSKPPRVAVTAERRGAEWVFAVADNGIGIDSRHHERIFEIFRRLHTHQEIPGTGIGLAICLRIVEHHGGRLWVESRPEEGSVFHFSLPARDGGSFS